MHESDGSLGVIEIKWIWFKLPSFIKNGVMMILMIMNGRFCIDLCSLHCAVMSTFFIYKCKQVDLVIWTNMIAVTPHACKYMLHRYLELEYALRSLHRIGNIADIVQWCQLSALFSLIASNVLWYVYHQHDQSYSPCLQVIAAQISGIMLWRHCTESDSHIVDNKFCTN